MRIVVGWAAVALVLSMAPASARAECAGAAELTVATCGNDLCTCSSPCARSSDCPYSNCCVDGFCTLKCVCDGEGTLTVGCDPSGGCGGSVTRAGPSQWAVTGGLALVVLGGAFGAAALRRRAPR